MFIKRNCQCVEFEENLDAVIGKQGGKFCNHNAQGVDEGGRGRGRSEAAGSVGFTRLYPELLRLYIDVRL